MRFIFHSPVNFEKWDWRNSIERGIGGSETSHVEMAWRLARRGHEVISYAPIPEDCPLGWRGTQWKKLEEVDWSQEGTWIIYRSPSHLDNFKEDHPNQKLWICSQDEDYGSAWNESRMKKVDRVLALSTAHARHILKAHPELSGKVWLTSNGVKLDLIREVEKETIPRNPHKLIYASSPDRGLMNLIKIFRRAKEYVDTLELHIFYGLDNIEKLIDFDPKFSHYRRFKDNLMKAIDSPGIHWRGRISQVELYKEWLSAGIWCYPTTFSETSCITCMEAQSLGAIPITNPYWALKDNVRHGVFIQGNVDSDMLAQARYTGEIVRLASSPELQQTIRKGMMIDARCRFNWERVVDQWESWALNISNGAYFSQFAFQLRHLVGRTLNIGCDNDVVGFKALGAVNMDVSRANPITGVMGTADVIGDIRNGLPKELEGRFDSVVMGDLIEHLSSQDAILALKNASKALENGGKVIITCPEDYRPVMAQHANGNGTETYAPGVSAYHERPITKEELFDMINQAGLEPTFYQELDYSHFTGHGVVSAPRK